MGAGEVVEESEGQSSGYIHLRSIIDCCSHQCGLGVNLAISGAGSSGYGLLDEVGSS